MGESRNNPRAREYKGPNEVLDARRRPLEPGDEIILGSSGPVYMRVVSVSPALDPRLPPGQMQITLGCVVHFLAQRGTVNPEFIRVRTAEEAGPLPMQGLPDDEPEDARMKDPIVGREPKPEPDFKIIGVDPRD